MENINTEIRDVNIGNVDGTASETTSARPESLNEANIELLLDVSLSITVELGRTRMKLSQILELQHGSVVELDRPAGDPVDIFVNDRMVAHGEVVVVDDKFGVRITEMVHPNTEKAAF